MRLFGRETRAGRSSNGSIGLLGAEDGLGVGPLLVQRGILTNKRKPHLPEADVEGVDMVGVSGGAAAAAALRAHLEGDDKDVLASQRWGVLSAVWILICLRSLIATVPALEQSRYELIFLYYQPLLLGVVMVWLWGGVLGIWDTLQIDPSPLIVFQLEDVRTHLTHTQVFQIAAVLSLLFLTNLSVFAWACANQLDSLASTMPVLAYMIPPAVLLWPFNSMYKKSRYFLVATVLRCLLPIHSISFADFFLADVFTSLAKAISDTERALCSMAAGPVLDAQKTAGGICGSASWHIPFWLAWPSICRLLQCLRQFYDTREISALGNALKYCSVFPVIMLSAMKYHASPEDWLQFYKPLWLTCSLLNSAFSFLWDVVFDFEFTLLSGRKCFTGRHFGLRNELLYSPDGKRGVYMYYWVLISNFLLRISWTYKLSSHLRSHQMMSTMVALGEVFRRFQWMFIRVERQYLSLTKSMKLSISYGNLN